MLIFCSFPRITVRGVLRSRNLSRHRWKQPVSRSVSGIRAQIGGPRWIHYGNMTRSFFTAANATRPSTLTQLSRNSQRPAAGSSSKEGISPATAVSFTNSSTTSFRLNGKGRIFRISHAKSRTRPTLSPRASRRHTASTPMWRKRNLITRCLTGAATWS